MGKSLIFPYTAKQVKDLKNHGEHIEKVSVTNRNSEFATRMRGLRKNRNDSPSQNDLAEAIGVTKSTINQYENGDSVPDARIIVRLAKYYNVSCDYLLCQTSEPVVNSDIRTAVKAIGLSGEAVKKIKEMVSSWNMGDGKRRGVDLESVFRQASGHPIDADVIDTTHYPSYMDILNAIFTDESSSKLNIGFKNGFLHVIKDIWIAFYLKIKSEKSGEKPTQKEYQEHLEKGWTLLTTDKAVQLELDTAAKDFRIIIQNVYDTLIKEYIGDENGQHNKTDK